eukprot:TRINITY_DN2255_c0_g1_i1.p1 TRINITY_DN2255_c0_g1~~TRINITY_DN2255_c0_g1_i1.p1  ORF type:complete len:113 (-),score=27.30 TRINITY_DN2255_c0_g1_i1:326-634(-)
MDPKLQGIMALPKSWESMDAEFERAVEVMLHYRIWSRHKLSATYEDKMCRKLAPIIVGGERKKHDVCVKRGKKWKVYKKELYNKVKEYADKHVTEFLKRQLE